MLFFGTRGALVQRQIAANQIVLMTYRYFHIWWVLRASYGTKYQLATATDGLGWSHRPLTEQEALQLLGGQPLEIPAWTKWSLLGALVLLLAFIVFGSLTGQ